MAEFQGNRISELKDPGCWRLCHVQTSGCMATERRTDEQREQQQIVLDYITDGGCDVAGLGDTRLGDDATEVCRMARGIEGRARGEALMRTLEGLDAKQRAAALEARTGVTRVNWQSAGSHKDESDIWRGGVALGSYGDAAAREFGVIDDARGWGRYTGRIYQGKGGKAMVVVVVYAPDAQYDILNEERGDYSQRLGQRAATVADGTTAGKWKPGKAMPKPTAEQVKHPKRLLFSDLKLQLWHYACKPLHTLVVMGDMNTDLYAAHRRGKDRDAMLEMMDELKLISCGQTVWPQSHTGFATHSGDSVHADSHIDYVLISESSATSVRRFGIHASPDLCEDRGGRHAALFVDVDVVSLMGIDKPQQPSTTKGRFQSAVKYSDKPRLARFRDFAENFFDKRGLNATMESLIGNVVLDEKLQQRAALERDESERRGWEQEHWRPAGAGRDGVRRDGGACGDGPATDANGGEGSKRRKTQEDTRSGGGASTAETSGRSYGVNCGAAAPDVTTTDCTLRSMIDDAMEFLDSMAHDVDLAFGQTHGGATRVRDKSNPDRFGNGHSAEAKRISLECKKLRRVVRFVHKKQLDKASQLCVTLAADGVELPDVHEDESAVIDSATSILKRKRLELQGRNRAQLILNSGGSSAKSQENKQRAATKRDVNAVMERSVRGAVASVTVGAGDAAEVLTDPLEVARECCEWSDRRMSLMQPKWFRRLDVAVGHAVWVADGAKVIGGLVHAIDNDGHYTVKPDTGALLFGVRRETLCLKWQVGSSLGAAAAATRGAHVDGDSRRRSNGVVNDGRLEHRLNCCAQGCGR